MSHEEANILKYGLGNSIPPEIVGEMFLLTLILRSNLSCLSNSYYRNYKGTGAVLKKQGILKKSRNSKGIVILSPDKSSGMVIMDKMTCKSKICELLNDKSKFKQLTSDLAKLREYQL